MCGLALFGNTYFINGNVTPAISAYNDGDRRGMPNRNVWFQQDGQILK